MENSSDIVINRSMKIIQSSMKLQVTRSFAENNLSNSALEYAEKTGTHYLWDWGKSAYIVVYELPTIFGSIYFGEVLRCLVNYCLPYMKKNNLTDSVVYSVYLENMNKEIIK